MRVLTCKNVSKEIDELERGQDPGLTIREHLDRCETCHNFYEDRLKLQQMIAGLDKVNAPGDFDFRLRARLASQRGPTGFRTGVLGFGFPSVALAVIALLVGVGLYMRATTDSVNQPKLAQAESSSDEPAPAKPAIAVPKDQTTRTTEGNLPEATVSTSGTKQTPIGTDRVRGRKTNRNFNSSSVRRDEFVARTEDSVMFPLEASEPLRLSVDYTTGTSRTISVPAVSFGSQQVVARGASMVKTSARTVW